MDALSPPIILAADLTKEVLLRGRLSIVDLPVLTSLDQIWQKATFIRRSTVLSLPRHLVFPDLTLRAT